MLLRSICLVVFFWLTSLAGMLAQENNFGCITVDFESLPTGEILTEGTIISNQYQASFGLSFLLEGGGNPVLAEIGEPRTAFGGAFGGDTPATGQGIGQFFLTDDGVLSGLDSPPVILQFDTPIDTFSGCILDMDFGEQFVIEAFDAAGATILNDTIRAGDPGTGDALATCWGFNLPGCEGIISRIRFSGFRTTSGAFGLGLDNFTFCYSGLFVGFETEDPDCLTELGSILVEETSSENYAFSLGGPFQEEGLFDNLPAGGYNVTIQDTTGCETSIPVSLFDPIGPTIVDANITNTSCAEDNGQIEIISNSSFPLLYIISGDTISNNNIINDLAAGDYLVYVTDSNGCSDSLQFNISDSALPVATLGQIEDDTCGDGVGSISISASNGIPPYEFAINEGVFQPDSVFTNLNAGNYSISVLDAAGCEAVLLNATINATPSISIGANIVEEPECLAFNGSITTFASGGTGNLTYSINGGPFITSNVFENLDSSVYTIIVSDELGCTQTALVEVPGYLCPIYIPNVISGNGDNTNDWFKAFTDPNYQVGILQYDIYDRWGELIFRSTNFNIHTRENKWWWDGTFKGPLAEEGVYTYHIRVRHQFGYEEDFVGDVTLLK